MTVKITTEELLIQYNLLKEEYIKLSNDKEVLINWGKPQLEALYTARIGVWLLNRLKTQLRIKGLQLKMEKIRSHINQLKPIDITAIELDVAASLAEAEATIMQEAGKIEKASIFLNYLETPERSGEIRKEYRQLAKQLHPDVNNNLTQVQMQLWLLVKEAYENGDLEKLKAIKLVYEKELAATDVVVKGLSQNDLISNLQVLKEGIRVLHEEINLIKKQFPFTLELQIMDDEWVKGEAEKLQEEINKLNQYEQDLTLEYEQMIKLL